MGDSEQELMMKRDAHSPEHPFKSTDYILSFRLCSSTETRGRVLLLRGTSARTQLFNKLDEVYADSDTIVVTIYLRHSQ